MNTIYDPEDDFESLPARRDAQSLARHTELPDYFLSEPPPAHRSQRLRRRLDALRDLVESHTRLGATMSGNRRAWDEFKEALLDGEIRQEQKLQQLETLRRQRLGHREPTSNGKSNGMADALTSLLLEKKKALAKLTKAGLKEGDEAFEMVRLHFDEQIAGLFT